VPIDKTSLLLMKEDLESEFVIRVSDSTPIGIYIIKWSTSETTLNGKSNYNTPFNTVLKVIKSKSIPEIKLGFEPFLYLS